MRPTALIPALCCLAALILSFLCLFAGSKKDFMEDYHILTLNTSRLGYNALDTLSNTDNPLSDLINLLPSSISDKVNQRIGAAAERLGVDDFYSVHILDYCAGDYEPGVMPNDTVKSSDIHKRVGNCSDMQALFKFDPEGIIEEKLNQTGTGITLQDLDWPQDIDDGIAALHAVQTAVFILYIIAIVAVFLALVASLASFFASGRLSACLNVMVSIIAFLAIGIGSALVTAVAVKGADVINEHGKQVGVEAHKGSKFLALTWAATALMFITLVFWCVETCVGRRGHKNKTYAKHG